VVAVIEAENIASRNVLEKIGFIDEGLREAYAAVIPSFRITRDQWLTNQNNRIE
jgi:RimJ/RimL family protein N-acetyltransferase